MRDPRPPTRVSRRGTVDSRGPTRRPTRSFKFAAFRTPHVEAPAVSRPLFLALFRVTPTPPRNVVTALRLDPDELEQRRRLHPHIEPRWHEPDGAVPIRPTRTRMELSLPLGTRP